MLLAVFTLTVGLAVMLLAIVSLSHIVIGCDRREFGPSVFVFIA